jgi:hypothetical protein
MKSWQLAVLGLAPLLIAGCRSDPAIPLLERELYRKDQEINRLRWQVEDLQGVANSCPEPSAVRDRNGDEREPESKSYRDHRGSNGLKPPHTEFGTPSRNVPDTLKPGVSPSFNVPPVPPGIEGPSRGGSNDDGPVLDGDPDRFSMRPARVKLASAQSAVPFRPSGDSRRVAAIAIDPAISGGIGSGDTSGDRGLLVAVQPRDARGRMVAAPAEVHVTAFDQSLRGEAARVGRWDFSPAETASLFCRTAGGGAIHLAMGWPDHPPKHKNLQLFVRYVTADGRKVDASQAVEIALPGERTARWTPAEKPAPAERPMRGERSFEREPAADSWRPDGTPIARRSETIPFIESRTADPGPERPVWSPERR